VTGKTGLRTLIFLRIAVGQDNSGKGYVPYSYSRLFVELLACSASREHTRGRRELHTSGLLRSE
jgi:hypothetical protein